jgi:hypothetical protein
VCNWPTQAVDVSAYPQQFWNDLRNSIIRGSADPVFDHHYDTFNFARRLYERTRVKAHFTGFPDRFDEMVNVVSARLMPYRTHTARAPSISMEQVGDVLVRAQDEVAGFVSVHHSHSIANHRHPFDRPGLLGAKAPMNVKRSSPAVVGEEGQDYEDDSDCPSSSAPLESASASTFATASTSSAMPLAGTSEATHSTGTDTSLDACTDDTVAEMDAEAGADTDPQVKDRLAPTHHGRCLEMRVRCLWLASTPGGGLLRYKLPEGVPLDAVVADFCMMHGLGMGQTRLAQVDMVAAARYAFARRSDLGSFGEALGREEVREGTFGPGVRYLDHARTMQQLAIPEGALLDLIFRPSATETCAPLRL